MHERRKRRAQSRERERERESNLMIFIFIWVITWMLSVPIFRYEQIAVHFTNHHACHVSWTATKNCRMLHLPSNNAFAGHDMSIEYLVNTHWPLFTVACNTPHSTNPYPSCMTASRSRTSWSQPAGLFHRSQVVRQFIYILPAWLHLGPGHHGLNLQGYFTVHR